MDWLNEPFNDWLKGVYKLGIKEILGDISPDLASGLVEMVGSSWGCSCGEKVNCGDIDCSDVKYCDIDECSGFSCVPYHP